MPFRESNRRQFLRGAAAAAFGAAAGACSRTDDKLVVLTFDDAVKSHRSFVAPLLKELGFGATFFVSHAWMPDSEHFMTWQEIAEIHEMGFEIGNHTWTHDDFSIPKNAARLDGELALVENELAKVEVPRPVSFAYCGNHFGPEAVRTLEELGFQFARRGMQPEIPYGTLGIGPAFEPARHHPLLIPTTADAYPDWTLDHFREVIAGAQPGTFVVLQFHGVPDEAHPWVHTPPEMFRQYMQHLKEEGYRGIAMRELEPFLDRENLPQDPLRTQRVSSPRSTPEQAEAPPLEVAATRAELDYWMGNMLGQHRYAAAEAGAVAGLTPAEVEPFAAKFSPAAAEPKQPPVKVLPYPGGRHPRIGFLEGAIDPLRGTKASVFLPWDAGHYVVVDLPEAIFCNLGLLFLAHTHLPTIWNDQNVVIDNVDWQRRPDGSLQSQWMLPNQVSFGGRVRPVGQEAHMELWLRNGSAAPLSELRTQICVLLKGAPDFNEQTMANRIAQAPVAAAGSNDGRRWILTAWEGADRSWGNRLCPCFHSDPVLPDCAPGQTVRVKGRLWFYEGSDVQSEVDRVADSMMARA